jgi:hypothetical protein
MSLELLTYRKPNPLEYFFSWGGLMLTTLWFLSYFMQINAYGTLGLMFIYVGLVILFDLIIPWGEVPK